MKLLWISSAKLNQHIEKLQALISDAFDKAGERRQKNVPDPFASLMVAQACDLDDERQLDIIQNTESGLRGMSNAIGKFHQDILASIDGWQDHDAGYDLECKEQKIIAEIKNKHNTMNAANARKISEELETAIRQKPGWTAYVVKIIPQKPKRYEIGLKKGVKETDGASFYHMATGHPNAIHDLFDCLCNKIGISNDIKFCCQKIMKNSLPPRI